MSQKVAIKYNCKYCDYICCKKSDYNKHILTAKHKKNENRTILNDFERKSRKKSQKVAIYICDCGKEYNVRNSLWYHKKKCSNNNAMVCIETEEKPSIVDIISQNKEIMDALVLQNEQLMKQNTELTNTIQEIVPKIGNNNNTINNNFNIQNFLNNDCKDAINFSEFIENMKVSFEDLENQAENGYIKGISKLFIDNLQELGTHKRPIHCTDKKRKTLYIKENDEWDKDGSQNTIKKGIQAVSRKTQDCLFQEQEENLEEYEDIESDFSQKYISIRRSLLPGFPQDTTINKIIDQISKESTI